MILAVASGKGGTGKTTIAVSLACALAAKEKVTLVDLDVEAPNSHLFLEPDFTGEETAFLPVPQVDEDACTRCGECSDICQFKAIALLGNTIITFPPLCHGCGACWTVCPEKCIEKSVRELGEMSWGKAGVEKNLDLLMGRLRIGEAMSPPLMRQVMEKMDRSRQIIIDAPPGTSCPMMTAQQPAEAVLLVTEPTPFGLHDFRLAVEALKPLNKPMGVIINRAGLGYEKVHEFCQNEGLEVLASIEYDEKIAQAYSRGERLIQAAPHVAEKLLNAHSRLEQLVRERKEEGQA